MFLSKLHKFPTQLLVTLQIAHFSRFTNVIWINSDQIDFQFITWLLHDSSYDERTTKITCHTVFMDRCMEVGCKINFSPLKFVICSGGHKCYLLVQVKAVDIKRVHVLNGIQLFKCLENLLQNKQSTFFLSPKSFIFRQITSELYPICI